MNKFKMLKFSIRRFKNSSKCVFVIWLVGSCCLSNFKREKNRGWFIAAITKVVTGSCFVNAPQHLMKL